MTLKKAKAILRSQVGTTVPVGGDLVVLTHDLIDSIDDTHTVQCGVQGDAHESSRYLLITDRAGLRLRTTF